MEKVSTFFYEIHGLENYNLFPAHQAVESAQAEPWHQFASLHGTARPPLQSRPPSILVC